MNHTAHDQPITVTMNLGTGRNKQKLQDWVLESLLWFFEYADLSHFGKIQFRSVELGRAGDHTQGHERPESRE